MSGIRIIYNLMYMALRNGSCDMSDVLETFAGTKYEDFAKYMSEAVVYASKTPNIFAEQMFGEAWQRLKVINGISKKNLTTLLDNEISFYDRKAKNLTGTEYLTAVSFGLAVTSAIAIM